jgi:hypothetical protein
MVGWYAIDNVRMFVQQPDEPFLMVVEQELLRPRLRIREEQFRQQAAKRRPIAMCLI